MDKKPAHEELEQKIEELEKEKAEMKRPEKRPLESEEKYRSHIKDGAEGEQADDKFRAVVDASPVPYALNDDNQNIIYLNPAFVDTFGYTLKDIPTLSEWWPRAYPDPDYSKSVSDSWQSRLDIANRSGNAFEPLEVKIRCKTGEYKDVIAHAESLAEDFKSIHIVVLYDISERKIAEERLRQSEAKYRRIVETASEGIWIIDVDNNTTYVNQQMAYMLGYSVAEMMGASLFEFVDKKWKAIAEEKMERQRQGIKEQHDFKFRRKNGTELWVIVSMVPIIDAEDRYTGTLEMVTDITERKRAEDELKNYRNRLEKLVEERTAELVEVNEELRRNMEETERFNRLALGRENRIIALKEEINQLLTQAGEGRRYTSV